MILKHGKLSFLIFTLLLGYLISIVPNNRTVMLVFASDSYGNDINFIEVWQWQGSDYELKDNFTTSGGTSKVDEDQAIKLIISIKFNDTLASSEAEAITNSRIYMNISEGIWTNEELNNTSCSHSGDFYWLKENGVWNQSGYPVVGVTYDCQVDYDGLIAYSYDTLNSPSAWENNEWTNPQNAFTSNNIRAYASINSYAVTYKNYGFNNDVDEGSTIDSVKVKVEGYVTVSGDQNVYAKVSWDGGTTWSSDKATGFGTSESTVTLDFSSVTAWTRDKLNNSNFRTKLWYFQGGGCYPNRTYFLGWDETAKEKETKWLLINIEDLKIGDKIFALDDLTKELVWTEVKNIEVHEGLWNLRDIYSGNLSVQLSEKQEWTWKAHNVFTENHPVEYMLKNGTVVRGLMKDLKEGYSLFHVFHDPPYFGTYVSPQDHYTKAFAITKIVDYQLKGTVYNVIATQPHERPVLKYLSDKEIANMTVIAHKYYNMSFAQFFDPPIGKTTGYVDWVPVEVNYTPPAEWRDVSTWTFQLSAPSKFAIGPILLRVAIFVTLNGEPMDKINITVRGGPSKFTFWKLTDPLGEATIRLKKGTYLFHFTHDVYHVAHSISIVKHCEIYFELNRTEYRMVVDWTSQIIQIISASSLFMGVLALLAYHNQKIVSKQWRKIKALKGKPEKEIKKNLKGKR